MAVHDMCTDIAALLHPMPQRADVGDEGDDGDEAYQAMAEAAWQQREELADELRLSLQEGGIDPLLSTLAGLSEQRLQLEEQMRLLMAYGRCFTRPRPYKLIDLARAAGLSISGVRIAFTDDEITQAAEILDRAPVSDDGQTSQVPLVNRQPVATAQKKIVTANLRSTVIGQASSTVQRGLVISSDPAQGNSVAADTLVTLYVSTGPAPAPE